MSRLASKNLCEIVIKLLFTQIQKGHTGQEEKSCHAHSDGPPIQASRSVTCSHSQFVLSVPLIHNSLIVIQSYEIEEAGR